MNVHPSKIPWRLRRFRCARCGGSHATWWGTVRAPSCKDGDKRVNDLVTFLDYQRLYGR